MDWFPIQSSICLSILRPGEGPPVQVRSYSHRWLNWLTRKGDVERNKPVLKNAHALETPLVIFLQSHFAAASLAAPSMRGIGAPLKKVFLTWWHWPLSYDFDPDILTLGLHVKFMVCTPLRSPGRVVTHTHTMSKLLPRPLLLGVKSGTLHARLEWEIADNLEGQQKMPKHCLPELKEFLFTENFNIVTDSLDHC